jgi:PhnB protein
MATNFQPEQYRTLTGNLVCTNANAAIDFYKKVFGAEELMRMPGPNNAVMHAELKIGDSIIFVADPMGAQPPAKADAGATLPCYLHVYVKDVDAAVNQAVELGARVDMPVDNMFWGDRYGKISDPYGQQWGVATHVEDVSNEEMDRRMKAMMSARAAQA